MQEPGWVSKRSVLALHQRQIAEFGGLNGIRDGGLLDSALGRAQNKLYYGETNDMAALAAAYAYGLATNHPFLDGNKRTALVVSFLFLAKNGWGLMSTEAENYDVIYRLAAGELAEEDLAAWFRAHMKAQG